MAPPASPVSRRLALKHLLFLGIGFVTLPILWEFVHLITLSRVAGFEAFQLHAEARYVLVRDDSTTIGDDTSKFNHTEFVLAKLLTVSQISHPNQILSLIMLIVVTVGGPVLVYYRRREEPIRNTILLVWLAWLIHTAWFVILSKQARVRHDWYALILAIMLFCWLVAYFWQSARAKPEWRTRWSTFSIAGVLTIIMLVNFFSQRHAAGLFIPDTLVETWRLNFLSEDTLVGKYEQQMPWVIIPRAQQDEAIDYLLRLPPTSQVFFANNVQVSELPVIVGRVFYPIQRRRLMAHSDDDVVVISGVFSPWRRPQSVVEPIKQEIKRQCLKIELENDYYIICSVSN